jgi:transmembrane sensor
MDLSDKKVKNRINDIDELIGKYLAGEASAEERDIVNSWCKENEANLQYFNHLRLIFDRSAAVQESIDVDADAAWNKVKSRLRQQEKIVPLMPERSSWTYLKIAASIAVVFAIGFFAYRSTTKTTTALEVIADVKTVTDTLPDGSEVVLNKKTQLQYAYNKAKKEHVVKLKGEAYFDIHHAKEENFIIDASGVFIRDIGTSFNVKAYPDSATIEVVVEEGEVKFYTAADTGLTLRAGSKGIYNKITGKFSIDRPEANVASYKTRNFFFRETRLEDVAKQINSVYDTKIIVADAVKDCAISVEFPNQPIDEIIAIIKETLEGITSKETPDGVLLDGVCEMNP